jgi:hypothetical protein
MRARRPCSELRTVRGNRLPLRRKNPYRPRLRMPLTPHRHQPLSVLSKCLCTLDDGLFWRSRLDLAEPLKLRSENVDRPSEDWFSCHSDEAYCTGVAPSRFAGPAPKRQMPLARTSNVLFRFTFLGQRLVPIIRRLWRHGRYPRCRPLCFPSDGKQTHWVCPKFIANV